jgi:hypothetical protein
MRFEPRAGQTRYRDTVRQIALQIALEVALEVALRAMPQVAFRIALRIAQPVELRIGSRTASWVDSLIILLMAGEQAPHIPGRVLFRIASGIPFRVTPQTIPHTVPPVTPSPSADRPQMPQVPYLIIHLDRWSALY